MENGIGQVLNQLISVGKAVAKVDGKQEETTKEISELKGEIKDYGVQSRERFEKFQQEMCIPHEGKLERHTAKIEAIGGKADDAHDMAQAALKRSNGKRFKDYAITVGSAGGTVGLLVFVRWICITFLGFDPFPFAGQ